jgi:hypothetical protein
MPNTCLPILLVVILLYRCFAGRIPSLGSKKCALVPVADAMPRFMHRHVQHRHINHFVLSLWRWRDSLHRFLYFRLRLPHFGPCFRWHAFEETDESRKKRTCIY